MHQNSALSYALHCIVLCYIAEVYIAFRFLTQVQNASVLDILNGTDVLVKVCLYARMHVCMHLCT